MCLLIIFSYMYDNYTKYITREEQYVWIIFQKSDHLPAVYPTTFLSAEYIKSTVGIFPEIKKDYILRHLHTNLPTSLLDGLLWYIDI